MKLRVIDDVRTELVPFLSVIILSRADSKSRISHNVGGWKSDYDFFDWPSHAVTVLQLELLMMLGGRPTGWAMVNRAGSYHKRHEHDQTYTCGVYYVAPGNPVVPTIFETENSGVTVNRYVYPKAGRLVIFPGSVPHSVPVYDGDEPRISIAFEIRPKL